LLQKVKLKNEEVKVNIIHSAVGGITESDIVLASASTNCFILGFNVRPTGSIKNKAKDIGLEIKTYSIIYDLLDDVEALLAGLMSPVISEENTGQAEVRDTFKVPKIGVVAGCFVSDGKVIKGGLARVIRDGVVIHDNSRLSSLKRFKDDVKEVTKGYECGIMIENYDNVQVGDVIETFVQKETQATL
jgi:translation initiation factor IF-2